MSNYIITTYPMLKREYLIFDVATEEEAYNKYYKQLHTPITDDEQEIILTIEIRLADQSEVV